MKLSKFPSGFSSSYQPDSGMSYHAPKGRFKLIYHGLILPNLPAPLHFLNFLSFIGQSKIPLFYNPKLIQTTALDTATVMAAISPHQANCLKNYSIEQQCSIQNNHYNFDQFDQWSGNFPNFQIKRFDQELEVQLEVKTTSVVSHFVPLKWNLFEHWSILCTCEGKIKYQNQHYQIEATGSFDYARAANIPYLPLAYYVHQVINLDQSTQIILRHVRNQWDQIIFSKIYIRNVNGETDLLTKDVHFHVQRVFPKIQTPAAHTMYLPREFVWIVKDHDQKIIFQLTGQSRGDFKFGVGTGYAGSFRYQIKCQDQYYEGESGYCEYIDLRPLNWQENNEEELNIEKEAIIQPVLLKK